jgi:hypothetical protein
MSNHLDGDVKVIEQLFYIYLYFGVDLVMNGLIMGIELLVGGREVLRQVLTNIDM